MKKQTLKKLILDTCTKIGFLFNNKFYQQEYSVSMSSSLGPVLTNNIMTELEDVVIKPLIAMVESCFMVVLLMTLNW